MERPATTNVEALGRAHAALLEDLRNLKAAIRPSAGEKVADLRARLRATQTHVTEHFRFEEQNGYLDAVQKREPRLERTIHQLADEHRQLAHSLELLLDHAGVSATLDEPLREEVREWIKRVRRHESHENDVIQDAFNLDIGAED